MKILHFVPRKDLWGLTERFCRRHRDCRIGKDTDTGSICLCGCLFHRCFFFRNQILFCFAFCLLFCYCFLFCLFFHRRKQYIHDLPSHTLSRPAACFRLRFPGQYPVIGIHCQFFQLSWKLLKKAVSTPAVFSCDQKSPAQNVKSEQEKNTSYYIGNQFSEMVQLPTSFFR